MRLIGTVFHKVARLHPRLEYFYRKYRKRRGRVVVVTSDMTDLVKADDNIGKAIIANSTNRFFLKSEQ